MSTIPRTAGYRQIGPRISSAASCRRPRDEASRKDRWLSAAQADQLRAGWDPPWQITTEHFKLSDQCATRRGDPLRPPPRSLSRPVHDAARGYPRRESAARPPLPRPRHDGRARVQAPRRLLLRLQAEYVDYFRNKAGAPDLEESLGYYEPPKSGRGRAPAYFFRDPNGQLPVEANLYHEVSHQLLFETAGPNAYTKNVGNYWVFEGLGTYFETVSPQDDGSLEVGGLVGRRIEEAVKSLVDQKREIPLAEFIALDQHEFKKDNPRILSLLPAGDGSGRLPHAMARRNLP